jgi:two-component system, LytTR family, response regulator
MMTLIALDDEPLALTLLTRYVEQLPQWSLLNTFTDAALAADFLKQQPVDLLLCDVNMPDISGLQLVQDMRAERPLVIFITAHKEFAHEGFNLSVLDYLVKPVSFERFKIALQKAENWLQLQQKAERGTAIANDTHFFVYSEYQQIRIDIQEVLYVESMGDYVKIYLDEQPKPVITLERIKNMADRLAPHGFRRIHRSYVVNNAYITALQKSRLKVGEVWLPIGEKYIER